MWHIAADWVALSVCWSYPQTLKIGWIDPVAVWEADSCSLQNYVSDGDAHWHHLANMMLLFGRQIHVARRIMCQMAMHIGTTWQICWINLCHYCSNPFIYVILFWASVWCLLLSWNDFWLLLLLARIFTTRMIYQKGIRPVKNWVEQGADLRETRYRWQSIGITAEQALLVWACAAKRRWWLGE